MNSLELMQQNIKNLTHQEIAQQILTETRATIKSLLIPFNDILNTPKNKRSLQQVRDFHNIHNELSYYLQELNLDGREGG